MGFRYTDIGIWIRMRQQIQTQVYFEQPEVLVSFRLTGLHTHIAHAFTRTARRGSAAPGTTLNAHPSHN